MKPLKKPLGYLPFIVGGGIVAYIAAFYLKRGIEIDVSPVGLFAAAAQIIAAVFLVLLFHESGHALGGKFAGMKFLFMSVGPFNLRREDGKFLFGLNKVFTLFGGVTACVPASEDSLHRKMLIYILGGPIAGLMTGSIFLFINSTIDRNSLALLTTGIGSLAVFVVSLIPGTAAGLRTDGAQALIYFKGGEQAEIAAKTAVAAMHSMNGIRPSEQNYSDIVYIYNQSKNDFECAVGSLLLYYYHADRDEWEKAEEYIRNMLKFIDSQPDLLKQSVYLENAFVDAFINKNKIAAEEFRRKIGRSDIPFNPAAMHRLNAAIHFAGGNLAACRDEATLGIALSAKVFDQGIGKFEISLCQKLLSSAE